MRENVPTIPDDGRPQQMQPLDRATALLLDSDDQWAYGGCNREAKIALQEELKEARALAENNGLLAKEKDSQITELDAQLVWHCSFHGFKKRISACSKIWDSFQHIFGAVTCIGEGHTAGINACLPLVVMEQVVLCGLLTCLLGAYWAMPVPIFWLVIFGSQIP